jgi:UDP-N-acetylmuramoylalanine--D-glutamate ligase
MDLRDPKAALDGQRITVMGLGRFGGGIGAARWLAQQGADVLVTDQAPAEQLARPLAELADLIDRGVAQVRLGGHNISDFTDCDGVIVNPAVPQPWENRFVRAAQAAGVPLTTEIELVVRRLPSRQRVIGVTGTAGKSTTAALIAHGLRGVGLRAHLGGNIGGSLLGSLGEVAADDWVVLELSSAMLHWLSAGPALAPLPAAGAAPWRWSPHIAVVTNLAPNHLDWHGDALHYEQSKRAIVREQAEGDDSVLGPGTDHWETNFGVPRLIVPPEAAVEGLAIPGRHNAFNGAVAVAAIGLAAPEGPPGRVEAALRSFGGLPHRLEFVGAGRGVRFYNDSKSTTPEASVRAIEALHESPQALGRIHLIAGGYDKHVDLAALSALAPQCAGVYTIGATGARLADGPGERFECGTLERAFARATERAREGDIVLLSPGCASWDQFENFEERGRMFCDLARAWMEEA